MSQNPKPPPRKTVALPPDVVERVDAFRKTMNIGSENDALRRLIEAGLNLFDKPRDLFLRCAQAHQNGTQLGDLIGVIINDHPLVEYVALNATELRIKLKDSDLIILERSTGEWMYCDSNENAHEFYPPRPQPKKNGWEPPSNLDDEIPF